MNKHFEHKGKRTAFMATVICGKYYSSMTVLLIRNLWNYLKYENGLATAITALIIITTHFKKQVWVTEDSHVTAVRWTGFRIKLIDGLA